MITPKDPQNDDASTALSAQASAATSLEEALHALKGILFQYANLYERWSEDRQVGARQAAALKDILDDLTKQVNRFASLDTQVEKALVDAVTATVTHASQQLQAGLDTQVRQELQTILTSLHGAVQQAVDVLTCYQRDQQTRWLWVVFGSIVTGLLVGLITAKVLLPLSLVQLTEQQVIQLQFGQRLEKVWGTLPQFIRQKILHGHTQPVSKKS